MLLLLHMNLCILPELLDKLLRDPRSTVAQILFRELKRCQQALFEVRYPILNIVRQLAIICVSAAQRNDKTREQAYST